MKRAMPWSDQEDDSSSSDESSLSQSDSEVVEKANKAKTKKSAVRSGKRKSGATAIDFEALKRHGYKGGLSVLKMRPPEEKPDWSWSTGKERKETKEAEDSYGDQQRTRAAILNGEQLVNVQTQKEKKNLSFSQKEKRKRELGQASRGKSYVEEEKRLLRESGIYSGFDT